MEQSAKKSDFQYRFDFEVGYLTKSPCKNCHSKTRFPKCFDQCKILDEIRGLLAPTVSCSAR
jgi:hypothetical protein